MPNPKRRQSKSRTRKRRTHHSLKPAGVSQCPNCGKDKRPHRVCPTCGYYKGKPVLSRNMSKS